MTAFDYFQHATVCISAGDRLAAIRSLEAAIAVIDHNGIDAALRADLAAMAHGLRG